MRREGLFVVVARRFTVRHTYRGIGLLIGRDHPRRTELRVEEVELHIGIVLGFLVRSAFDGVADVTILHITKEIERGQQGVVGTKISISVRFLARIVIILLVGHQLADVVLHPKHLAEVVVLKIICAHATGEIEGAVAVVERHDGAAEVPFELLTTDDVGLLHLLAVERKGLQTKRFELLVVLIFLIITIAVGVVEGGGEVEVIGQLLCEQNLGVLLEIEVDLIFVELPSLSNRAVGIVSSVCGELFTADTVPSMVGFFASAEEDEFQRGPLIEISPLEEIRTQACRSAIAVAVGSKVRQTRVERPMVGE